MHPQPPRYIIQMAHGKDKIHIPVSVQVCEEVNSDSITLMKSLLIESDRNKGKCIKGIQGRRDVGENGSNESDTEENKQEKKKQKDEVIHKKVHKEVIGCVLRSMCVCVCFLFIIYSDISFSEHLLISPYTRKHKHTQGV